MKPQPVSFLSHKNRKPNHHFSPVSRETGHTHKKKAGFYHTPNGWYGNRFRTRTSKSYFTFTHTRTRTYFQFFLFTHTCSVSKISKITFTHTLPVLNFFKKNPYPYKYRPVLVPWSFSRTRTAVEISKPSEEETKIFLLNLDKTQLNWKLTLKFFVSPALTGIYNLLII